MTAPDLGPGSHSEPADDLTPTTAAAADGAPDDLEELRPDLEALLVEVVQSVFLSVPGDGAFTGDAAEAGGVPDEAATEVYLCDPGLEGPHLVSALALRDDGGAVGAVVEVRLADPTATLLAGRMFGTGAPDDDDLADAVGELGNIAAGNIKALLGRHARLSLPSVRREDGPQASRPGEVAVAAALPSGVVELSVHYADASDRTRWPGALPAVESVLG